MMHGIFAEILEAELYKTATVWPLTSHLETPKKHTEHYWRSKDQLINNVLPWTNTHGHTSVGWLEKNLYSPALCRHWMQSSELAKSDD